MPRRGGDTTESWGTVALAVTGGRRVLGAGAAVLAAALVSLVAADGWAGATPAGPTTAQPARPQAVAFTGGPVSGPGSKAATLGPISVQLHDTSDRPLATP